MVLTALAETFETAMARLGVQNDDTVVVYGGRNCFRCVDRSVAALVEEQSEELTDSCGASVPRAAGGRLSSLATTVCTFSTVSVAPDDRLRAVARV